MNKYRANPKNSSEPVGLGGDALPSRKNRCVVGARKREPSFLSVTIEVIARNEAVHGVGNAVNVANLIAIIGRYREFKDTFLSLCHRKNDLCIEVPRI